MALVRWEPFRELASLSEMSRLMSGLLEGQGSRAAQSWIPPLDVWETEQEVVYAFDLPRIAQDKISLEVQDDTLTVTAERERISKESSEHFFRFERRYGTFTRAVGLPQGVNEDSIRADYKDGVLEVHVPKPEEQKPKRITLGGNGVKADIEGTSTPASN
jgi:HSP20 family protein